MVFKGLAAKKTKNRGGLNLTLGLSFLRPGADAPPALPA